ncbi:MAG TPA: response regulator [Burkholderiales bacterium]|nr:response regulator [Burkholderiales bacterium]
MIGKPTVLVVDDKRANQVALEALLGADYNLVFANSGAEGIAMVQKVPHVDVILMDVQMPEMDGFQAAREIKKTPAGGEIPIIFVTAVFNEDPFIRRGYEAGGLDYFSKPFDPAILKMKIGIYASFRTREKLLRARERHIRESEELLRVGRKLSSMLESLRVGVMIADVEGRICQTTQEVARIFRCAEQMDAGAYGEMVGWWDSAGAMIRDGKGPLARALQNGETSHGEPMAVRCLDGSSVTVIASAAPLRGLDEKLVGAVVLIQDVTEPRRIEEALEERVTRLIGAGLELEESAVRSN